MAFVPAFERLASLVAVLLAALASGALALIALALIALALIALVLAGPVWVVLASSIALASIALALAVPVWVALALVAMASLDFRHPRGAFAPNWSCTETKIGTKK